MRQQLTFLWIGTSEPLIQCPTNCFCVGYSTKAQLARLKKEFSGSDLCPCQCFLVDHMKKYSPGRILWLWTLISMSLEANQSIQETRICFGLYPSMHRMWSKKCKCVCVCVCTEYLPWRPLRFGQKTKDWLDLNTALYDHSQLRWYLAEETFYLWMSQSFVFFTEYIYPLQMKIWIS